MFLLNESFCFFSLLSGLAQSATYGLNLASKSSLRMEKKKEEINLLMKRREIKQKCRERSKQVKNQMNKNKLSKFNETLLKVYDFENKVATF